MALVIHTMVAIKARETLNIGFLEYIFGRFNLSLVKIIFKNREMIAHVLDHNDNALPLHPARSLL